MIRSPAAPSLGLPPYNWWEEATHGVGTNHENTNVAFPITTAMSFNRSLWKATGALIGTEARALMNQGAAGSDFWVSSTPNPSDIPCHIRVPINLSHAVPRRLQW
jgi:beta-glucosidase-like glycosyl hydrolase